MTLKADIIRKHCAAHGLPFVDQQQVPFVAKKYKRAALEVLLGMHPTPLEKLDERDWVILRAMRLAYRSNGDGGDNTVEYTKLLAWLRDRYGLVLIADACALIAAERAKP